MTSYSRQKGTRNETKCRRELESKGYLVDKVERTGSKYLKQRDLFGLFDLVAVHKKKGYKLVQVTTNRPHQHKQYEDFSKEYPHANYEQWVHYDRKGWKIFTYKKGKRVVTDLRKSNNN